MSAGPPLVSVLLLTRDGGGRLATVLAALASQDTPFEFEVVAVDSESRDGSLDRLRNAGAKVLQIPRAEFNHGTTRNLGIAACRGSIVVLLVQDAEPGSSDWLVRLVEPLLADEGVAGSYGRQVAPPGAGAIARAYHARYPASASEPRIQAIPARDAFLALPPLEQMHACTFDNVCSSVRKSAWSRHPFPRVPIAEDLEWARDVLLDGYRLAYVPAATVRHLHDRPAGYELRRTYLVHQRLRALFGVRTVPSLPHLARAIGVSLASHGRWVAADTAPWTKRVADLPRAAALAVALPLGQYLGAKSVDRGRELLRVEGI
jgi:rhamnosyltransferase